MDEPRRIPIHRSLNRPNLLLGGDRELVLMTMLCAAMVGFTASSLLQLGIGVVLWLAVHAGLVQMAKADPNMRDVYVRHVKYRAFYSARTGHDSKPLQAPEWKD